MMKVILAFLLGFSISWLYKPSIDTKDISNINNHVENINAGGCAYFAMEFYKRADKKKLEFVSINKRSHFMVHLKNQNYFIDSKGIHDSMYIYSQYGLGSDIEIISYDSLKYQWDCSRWNPKFNRKDTIYIDYYLNDLFRVK